MPISKCRSTPAERELEDAAELVVAVGSKERKKTAGSFSGSGSSPFVTEASTTSSEQLMEILTTEFLSASSIEQPSTNSAESSGDSTTPYFSPLVAYQPLSVENSQAGEAVDSVENKNPPSSQHPGFLQQHNKELLESLKHDLFEKAHSMSDSKYFHFKPIEFATDSSVCLDSEQLKEYESETSKSDSGEKEIALGGTSNSDGEKFFTAPKDVKEAKKAIQTPVSRTLSRPVVDVRAGLFPIPEEREKDVGGDVRVNLGSSPNLLSPASVGSSYSSLEGTPSTPSNQSEGTQITRNYRSLRRQKRKEKAKLLEGPGEST